MRTGGGLDLGEQTEVIRGPDAVGGLVYPGYSFSSQMVSELMAVGAPSERFVDPPFLLFGVLVIAFGVGVFREGLGGNRPLKVTGALLAAYGAIGLTGPTLFEMHPRGSTGVSDVPPTPATRELNDGNRFSNTATS